MKYSLLICLFLAGCAHTATHKGILYSFHHVNPLPDGSWYLELVGGLGHNQTDLLEITRDKAVEICKGKPFTIETGADSQKLNTTIPTGTTLGFINVSYPVLKSVVKCS